MDINIDNLKRLVESLRNTGFWGRLFGWGKIKNQLIDASADLQKLVSHIHYQQDTIATMETGYRTTQKDLQVANDALSKKGAALEKLDDKNNRLITENKELAGKIEKHTETITGLTKRETQLTIELEAIKNELRTIQQKLSEVKDQNTQLLKDEEFRKQEHSNSVSALTKIREQIQEERSKEIQQRNEAEIEKLRQLKETWNRHEEMVMSHIKTICQRHTIQYIEKVPFKGDPDNTLLICDEYVVFDAKSPGSDSISNFPNYLKDQAEKAKKYARQENVKSDIFFVVPSNSLEHLSTFVYRFGDHTVYIISVDALEPVILNLKKIEDYEFAEQLSPEDRDNICRILGRFAHLSKRRIQIDSFFAKQFIELAYKCEADLPPDILENVIAFEKTEKLNPPMEKRAKAIPIAEVESETKKIKNEADGRGIIMNDENISDNLDGVPLYKKE